MMSIYGCKHKKDLKGKVGQSASMIMIETSIHGSELKDDGEFCVVGPSPYKRKWYATVTVEKGLITKVT